MRYSRIPARNPLTLGQPYFVVLIGIDAFRCSGLDYALGQHTDSGSHPIRPACHDAPELNFQPLEPASTILPLGHPEALRTRSARPAPCTASGMACMDSFPNSNRTAEPSYPSCAAT